MPTDEWQYSDNSHFSFVIKKIKKKKKVAVERHKIRKQAISPQWITNILYWELPSHKNSKLK